MYENDCRETWEANNLEAYQDKLVQSLKDHDMAQSTDSEDVLSKTMICLVAYLSRKFNTDIYAEEMNEYPDSTFWSDRADLFLQTQFG
jgi:hypothetical protein